MMRNMVIGVFVLYSSALAAQQTITPLATHVTMSTQDCQKLVKHIQDADVSYKPGVDVHGKPVVPADLPSAGGGFKLPDHIEFNYTINPMQYGAAKTQTAANPVAAASNSMMSVGTIRYDFASGQVTYNGQPLNASDQQNIAAECRKQGIK